MSWWAGLARKLGRGAAFAWWCVTHKGATPRRVVNALAVYVQFKVLRSRTVRGYPIDITVEPTNFCNLRCPLCPTSTHQPHVSRGMMKLDDFKTIIDRLGPYLFSLELHNWGEPLLHKDIVAMIRYATAKKIVVRLSSNLNLLPHDDARALVESGLDTLIVSMEGVDQETYGLYRRGGDLKKAMDNLVRIREAREALGVRTPNLVWHYIRTRDNAGHVEQARKIAGELGMVFVLSDVTVNFGLTRTFEEALAEHYGSLHDPDAWLDRREEARKERDRAGFCDWPYLKASVNWDGHVWPCCQLYRPQEQFGNMLREDFKAIWNGPRYREGRDVIAGRKHGTTHICEFCRRNSG